MTKAVYIHIPFCNTICSYCDFCKFYYNEKIVNNYLQALEREIKSQYKNELIETVYIGGGTPSSLNIKQMEKLFSIIKIFRLKTNYEFTFECNVENINYDKLKFLFKNKVNRLSIGVQTFNQKHLEFLERKHNQEQVFEMINMAKQIGFNNINMDLMYAFKNQTLDDVKEDINLFLKLNIPHISVYSLIIEPHTKLYINKVTNIDEEIDYEMYEQINQTLNNNGYRHYEISNYCQPGFESKHNLTYWNNEQYYGFGLGSSGYIENIRYTNFKNIGKYNQGIIKQDRETIDDKLRLEYEFILGFRKIEGINKKQFYEKFKYSIEDHDVIKKILETKKLIDTGSYIRIADEYIYLSNDILREFV
ncbi:MAG: radical SAM family heme chaperone HemW [Bacilli bacterium]|nr:radical SAM family heme chaperone HemW [Bacilli bacterium]